ncbi:MAG TPA: phosphatase PAP2 family protein [Vicinamibacterales bacterium]|nr:phosphatase PAP2 family protein [Vicinamibacterales bacterium]
MTRHHACILTIGASLLVAVTSSGVRTASAQTHSLFAPSSMSAPVRLTASFVNEERGDQDPAPEPQKPTRGFAGALGHNLVDDMRHLPRRNSVYWLVGGGIAALAVHPIDDDINRRLLGSDISNVFIPGKYIGSTEVQVGAALTTYIVGRARHQTRVQHIGMDLLEAQLLTEGIVELTKVAVRRDRPINPDGSHYPGYSFPSGHAAITFASATVLQQHLGWRAAVPTYALATYVAASRLHDNRHFASDVVFGAAVGVVVGRSVTWHGRNTYTLSPAALPGGLGAMIVW